MTRYPRRHSVGRTILEVTGLAFSLGLAACGSTAATSTHHTTPTTADHSTAPVTAAPTASTGPATTTSPDVAPPLPTAPRVLPSGDHTWADLAGAAPSLGQAGSGCIELQTSAGPPSQANSTGILVTPYAPYGENTYYPVTVTWRPNLSFTLTETPANGVTSTQAGALNASGGLVFNETDGSTNTYVPVNGHCIANQTPAQVTG